MLPSCKLAEALILILEMSLLVSVLGDGNNISAGMPSEEQGSAPCRDLEPAFRRLRNIPGHLHPEALRSGIGGVGIDASQHIWRCPENKEEEEDNYPSRGDFHLGLYCEDVELLFSLYNDNEMDGHPHDFNGFDYQSWCKSPNVESKTTSQCDLCSEGTVLKPNFMQRVFNDESTDKRFRLTCAEASEYAKHITEARSCNDTLDKARAFCCTQRPKIDVEDVQMTLVIILLVTAASALVVCGLLYVMECIDNYFFSGNICDDSTAAIRRFQR